MKNLKDLVWIEISKKSIENNVGIIRQIIGKETVLSVVVKSNAYGHGLILMSKFFLRCGVDWLCVASVSELIELRRNNIKCPILVMGPLLISNIEDIIKFNARIFIYDIKFAKKINDIARKYKKIIKVHLKIDTGLGRLGIHPNSVEDFINELKKLKNIYLEGVATHFATSDNLNNRNFFEFQLDSFKKCIFKIKKLINRDLLINCANSSAILTEKNSIFNMVRVGSLAYGYYNNNEIKIHFEKKTHKKFKRALSLKTKIMFLKNVDKNSCIGYNYQANGNFKIGILPIGYGDVLSVKLKEGGYFLLRGKKVSIIGNIQMSYTAIDVTNFNKIKELEEVVIVGEQLKSEILIEDITTIEDITGIEFLVNLKDNISKYLV